MPATPTPRPPLDDPPGAVPLGVPGGGGQHHRQRGPAQPEPAPGRLDHLAAVDRRRLQPGLRRAAAGRGGIGDRLGRKGVMQVGLVFFGIFSAAAAASHTTGTLIASRALMGVAAAFIFPATLAILTSVFTDHAERQKAWASGGPPRGSPWPSGRSPAGRSSSTSGTGRSFWSMSPSWSSPLSGAPCSSPRSGPRRNRFDTRGVVISTMGVSMLVLAIIEGPQWGWGSAHPELLRGGRRTPRRFHRGRAGDRCPAPRRPGLHRPPLLGRGPRRSPWRSSACSASSSW